MKRIALLLAALMLAALLPVGPSVAHDPEPGWPPDAVVGGVLCFRDGTTSTWWQDQIDNAASKWDNDFGVEVSNRRFTGCQGGTSKDYVRVFMSGTPVWGDHCGSLFQCNGLMGLYRWESDLHNSNGTSPVIHLFQDNMSSKGLTGSEKIAVIVHEFGHAFELGHVPSNDPDSIMNVENPLDRNSLSAHDKSDYCAIYGSPWYACEGSF